jgi:hypothetical protein
MKTFIIIIVTVNLLLYALAFRISLTKHQSIVIYCVCLGIQLLLLLLELNNVGYVGGGGDAAGDGMAQGYLHFMYIILQVIVAFFVLLTFVMRQLTENPRLRVAIIAAILLLLYVFIFTDFRHTFLLLTTLTATDESKLVFQDGIVYTLKDKPFTGVSIVEDWIICPQEQEQEQEVISEDNSKDWTANILDTTGYQTWIEAFPKDDSDANVKAWLETRPEGVTITYENGNEEDDVKPVHDDKRAKGLRITHYKNGLKHGKEKHYYTNDIILFGNRTELHCTTIYENGQVIDHQID